MCAPIICIYIYIYIVGAAKDSGVGCSLSPLSALPPQTKATTTTNQRMRFDCAYLEMGVHKIVVCPLAFHNQTGFQFLCFQASGTGPCSPKSRSWRQWRKSRHQPSLCAWETILFLYTIPPITMEHDRGPERQCSF